MARLAAGLPLQRRVWKVLSLLVLLLCANGSWAQAAHVRARRQHSRKQITVQPRKQIMLFAGVQVGPWFLETLQR